MNERPVFTRDKNAVERIRGLTNAEVATVVEAARKHAVSKVLKVSKCPRLHPEWSLVTEYKYAFMQALWRRALSWPGCQDGRSASVGVHFLQEIKARGYDTPDQRDLEELDRKINALT